jgi:hypothetical protein
MMAKSTSYTEMHRKIRIEKRRRRISFVLQLLFVILLSALTAAAAEYRADKKTLKEFAAAFDEATPVFPLVYREGVLIAAADLGDFTQTGAWAVYGDISKLITMETETTT